MRVDEYAVGSYLHVIKRGTRGMDIVRDESDKWRFLKMLYYLNNVGGRKENWDKELLDQKIPLFTWPPTWPEREPLTHVLAYTLMPNHFHLLLKETKDGGISKFMQGLCTSMSMHFNEKYKEKGSIFQGAFKARNVSDDSYLRRVAIYIMVKNTFELLPGGLEKANDNFEIAWNKSLEYQFSSLEDYGSTRKSPIITREILLEIFPSPKDFKSFAKETMEGRILPSDETEFN